MLGLDAAVALVSGLIGIGQQHHIDSGSHRQGASSSAGATKPPVLVHIILDEHLGIEGFSDLGRNGRELKQQLKAFYASHGFRLFGRAYAEQFRTVNSIPQILNFGKVLKPDDDPFDGKGPSRATPI